MVRSRPACRVSTVLGLHKAACCSLLRPFAVSWPSAAVPLLLSLPCSRRAARMLWTEECAGIILVMLVVASVDGMARRGRAGVARGAVGTGKLQDHLDMSSSLALPRRS